jgi:hypothetical protein
MWKYDVVARHHGEAANVFGLINEQNTKWPSRCLDLILRSDSANSGFEFDKRRQLVIGANDESLSVVAVCVATKIVRPLESIVATQPQLQPARLRLSAMISPYFTVAICSMRRAVRLWLVFPVPADVRDMSESHDHPAAVFACRRFAQVPRSQAARLGRVRLP